MWAGIFAQPVLLLLLLFYVEVSDSRQLEDTMGAGKDNRNITVAVDTWALDMEYEQVRCRCEQQWRLGREDFRWEESSELERQGVDFWLWRTSRDVDDRDLGQTLEIFNALFPTGRRVLQFISDTSCWTNYKMARKSWT